ncbi:MAG: DEAD/DEAH box helicase [Betaproteobacteria bacterium]
MNFSELGLHAAILQAITESGYTEPTPVQAQAIPAALEGRDLMVSSQTGSGKTAAFMLPAIHRFATTERESFGKTPNQEKQSAQARGERPRFQPARPRMLVLTPTRELAMQVTAATDKYGAHVRRLRTVSILGGMPYPKQLQLLSRNPEILVATPGRLIDHLNSRKIDFSNLEILVLDEADRMLDMGFIEDIELIVAATPATRQTMLFSATMEGQVGKLAERMTRDPLTIRIASATTKHENIEQRIHFVDDMAHKNRLLDHLLRDAELHQALVFTATKRNADQIADDLCEAGFSAAALHGDMQQRARNRTLEDLRRGNIRILVATDVAARGIDVPGITHVFNYDLPKFAEDYVHRIGRTGRAGRLGTAVSLVHHSDGIHVKRIERFTRQTIAIGVVEGHEPKKSAPVEKKRKPDGWKSGPKRYGDSARPEWRGSKPAAPHREGGYRRDGDSAAAPTGAPKREWHGEKPAFARDGKPGGFKRDGKPSGFSRDGAPRRESYGDRPPRKSGGFAKPASRG